MLMKGNPSAVVGNGEGQERGRVVGECARAAQDAQKKTAVGSSARAMKRPRANAHIRPAVQPCGGSAGSKMRR